MDNCGSARDEILITSKPCDIYFPSAFTPNNDGKNDLFKMLGGNNLKDFHLVVYDRWGKKVFESFDYAKGWNGSLNGKLQASGTFVWYCEFKQGGSATRTNLKGTVTLVR
jgi:gliding motility-associated-like protein